MEEQADRGRDSYSIVGSDHSEGIPMRARSFCIAVAVTSVVGLSGSTATAAPTDDTTVTFAVNATDGLNITAPASASLSATTPGNDSTGQMGVVTVTDERSTLNTTWEATVTSTEFTTGGGTPAETIGSELVDYSPGAAINPVNGPFTAGSNGDLSDPLVAFSRASGNGNNSVSWNPTLTVNVPAAAVAGTYTGTVTHSVA
ncbi:hypothetical protein ACIQMR_10455 [Streptomyces sp. NPDC091376]|uniref:hypothetical protein n=1 Tax=Streptomyces sp. NPDC091376 TaxID=3365994 RepID=UPI00382985D7